MTLDTSFLACVALAVIAFGAARAGRHPRQGTLVRWIAGAPGTIFVTLAGSLAVSRI